MKPRNKYYDDYSNYGGLIIIYLVSVAVATTIIFPGEEHWYVAVIKAIVWPLYLTSKIL